MYIVLNSTFFFLFFQSYFLFFFWLSVIRLLLTVHITLSKKKIVNQLSFRWLILCIILFCISVNKCKWFCKRLTPTSKIRIVFKRPVNLIFNKAVMVGMHTLWCRNVANILRSIAELASLHRECVPVSQPGADQAISRAGASVWSRITRA